MAAEPQVPDVARVAVVVLGMHRSGTSALTWLIGRMGAALPRDPIDAGAENSRGYFESGGLVAADDRLVRAAGSSWFDPRALDLTRVPAKLREERLAGIRAAIVAAWGTAPLIAVKDPRLCRLVPTFAGALGDLGVQPRAVLMLRSAADVAASLARRDATTPACARLLWLRHMLDAERDSRAMPRVVVGYDAMLDDWRTTARRIAQLLGREDWDAEADAAEIGAFLDPALRHHTGSPSDGDGPLGALIADAERGFAMLLADDAPPARVALDAVRAALDAAPWIEADVIHDELRHRRAPAAPGKAAVAPPPAEPEAPPPEPPPAPPPEPDRDGDARLIADSGLFDADWYRATYPDVAESGVDPIAHYLETGAAEGRNPHPLFDTAYYARQMARRA